MNLNECFDADERTPAHDLQNRSILPVQEPSPDGLPESTEYQDSPQQCLNFFLPDQGWLSAQASADGRTAQNGNNSDDDSRQWLSSSVILMSLPPLWRQLTGGQAASATRNCDDFLF